MCKVCDTTQCRTVTAESPLLSSQPPFILNMSQLPQTTYWTLRPFAATMVKEKLESWLESVAGGSLIPPLSEKHDLISPREICHVISYHMTYLPHQ